MSSNTDTTWTLREWFVRKRSAGDLIVLYLAGGAHFKCYVFEVGMDCLAIREVDTEGKVADRSIFIPLAKVVAIEESDE